MKRRIITGSPICLAGIGGSLAIVALWTQGNVRPLWTWLAAALALMAAVASVVIIAAERSARRRLQRMEDDALQAALVMAPSPPATKRPAHVPPPINKETFQERFQQFSAWADYLYPGDDDHA